jgi:hypothetical protein
MKGLIKTAGLMAVLAGCGGSAVTAPVIPTPPTIPSIPSTPTIPGGTSIRPPSPGEIGTASLGFGDFTVIDKRTPNPVDGVRYVDAIRSNGTTYNVGVFSVEGPTGSSNILYRGDGAYFHDYTEEQEKNLAAGIGFRSDGTWLGGYMVRNGETFFFPPGSATFEGGYRGHIMEFAALNVRGNVRLDADFENSSISGAITDRQVGVDPFGVNNPQYIRNDIALDASAISTTGTFGGAVSQNNGATLQGARGYYGGIFDQTAERAIGVLQVDHYNEDRAGGIAFPESGIFVVE